MLPKRLLAAALAATLALTACTSPNAAPAPTPEPPTATPAPATPPPSTGPAVVFTTPPRALMLPQDDAPHRDPLEWWYYTGHLGGEGRRKYGFEFVIFQRITPDRKDSAGYVGHFAITDMAANKFIYSEKLNLAPLPAEGGRGFNLKIDNWTMTGADGRDKLVADLEGYKLDLSLTTTKPPIGHGTTGYILVSPTEYSYYYSRTRMSATGTLTVDGAPQQVTGDAWFDHQWGQMTLSGGGGWDWFAVMLEDGTEIMLSLIRGADGKRIAAYGTYVMADGKAIHIPQEDLQARNNGVWISQKTGGRYPMGWTIVLPRLGLDLTVSVDLLNQELDTTASTGQTYWEGKARVQGFKDDKPINGDAYVELTGYVAAKPATSQPAPPRP